MGNRSGGAPPIVKATLSESYCDPGTMEETIETASSCLPFSHLPHNFEVQLLYRATIFLLSPCLLFTYSTVQYMNKLNAESSLDTREGEHQSEIVFQDSQQQSKLLGPISLEVLLKKQVM